MADQLERLLGNLAERAKAEIADATAAGLAEAERIRSAADASARERLANALAECEAEQSHRRSAAIASTRRRGRGALLDAQHALVDRVLARTSELVEARLRAADPDAMHDRVGVLVSYASENDPQVRQSEEGIRMVADGGHLRIDDTVAAWLDQRRAELAIEICRAIDAPATGGPTPC